MKLDCYLFTFYNLLFYLLLNKLNNYGTKKDKNNSKL